MKFPYFAIVALAALAHARDAGAQNKRGAYANPEQRAAAVDSQQQYQGQQYYHIQPSSQAVVYAQPAVAKYVAAPAAPIVQKIAFAQPQQLQLQQPVRRPQLYSSAADVSSFSYNSPVVAYSNLGVLRPVLVRPQPVVQAAASSYPSVPVAVQYVSPGSYPAPSNLYQSPAAYQQAVAPKAAYSEARQVQQPQPQSQAQPQSQPQVQAPTGSYPVAAVSQKAAYRQSAPAYQARTTVAYPVQSTVAYEGHASQAQSEKEPYQPTYSSSDYSYKTVDAPSFSDSYESPDHSSSSVYSEPSSETDYLFSKTKAAVSFSNFYDH